MSVHVLSWAWQQPVGDPAAKLLLMKLADQANDRGECWPSKRTMARDCEMSESSAHRKMKTLVDKGLVLVEERVLEGRQSSNLYRLPFRETGVNLTPPGVSPDDTPRVPAVTPFEPSVEPGSLLKERARPDVWNPIYDALVRECYPRDAVLTRDEQARVVKAAKNIASAGATAEQVSMVRAAYQAHTSYSRCALTAMALSSRWAELAPTAILGTACEECGLTGGRHVAGCSRAAAA